jgi:hypothetical protein
VAFKTTGDFGAYGTPCEVSSPPVPSIVNYCGATVPAMTTNVATLSLASVTQYRFQIIRASDNTTATVDRPIHYFNFNIVPAAIFIPGELYYVRVAMMTTSTWSPFGDACEIIAPGGTLKGIPTTTVTETVSTSFQAAAYPNPFTSNFSIDVTTANEQNVQLKVYDMLGKLIESREINAADVSMEKLGTQYPSGVYNVIVSQQDEIKTLRVIKR